MIQKPILENQNSTQLQQGAPVFLKAKLKDDFDIETVLINEETLNQGTDKHAKIIEGLLELLNCANDNEECYLDSELAYSSLTLLNHLTFLQNMAKVFIAV